MLREEDKIYGRGMREDARYNSWPGGEDERLNVKTIYFSYLPPVSGCDNADMRHIPSPQN